MASTAAARTTLAANINDNSSGDITPADLRATIVAVIDALETTAPSIAQYGATGNGTADDRAAFVSAESAGSSYTLPAGTYRIATNITLSKVLAFAPGAILKPAAGVTVTLTGQIVAGFWQIFDTSLGGVIAGPVTNKEIYPDWWGAKPNIAANQQPALQSAITFAQNGNRTVFLRNGLWRCDATLTLSKACSLEGDPGLPVAETPSAVSSVLDFSLAPSSSDGLVVRDGTVSVDGVSIRNIILFRSATPVAAAGVNSGLAIWAANHGIFENILVWGFDFSYQLAGFEFRPLVQCTFRACRSRNAGTYHWNIWSAIDCRFESCPSEQGTASIGFNIWSVPPATLPNALHFRDCVLVGEMLDGVRISAGFWHTFSECVFESMNNNGIVTTLPPQDLSLLNVTVQNCWFNDCGVPFSSAGSGGNYRLLNNRMEVGPAAEAAGIYVSIPTGGPIERDILISGNVIKSAVTGSTGIMIDRASGIMITSNRILMTGAAAGQPAITALSLSANCLITENISYSNTSAAGGVSDNGSNNTVLNNIRNNAV